MKLRHFERNVCLKRKSFHVYTTDRQGYFTKQVRDPLAAIIGYLRDEKWYCTHATKIDDNRLDGLNEALAVCIDAYNRMGWNSGHFKR